MCIVSLAASAQERTVQNRPYTDLRPFHFGVVVGTHVQDMEVRMAGPMTITTEDGTQETLVTADQSRWDPGINVGVLGELRLSTHLQLRVAPMMYFGTRHIVFQDLKNLSASGKPEEKRQDMKTAYIAVAGDIIFAAPRFNNHRPYLMAGVSPMINLTGKSTDALKHVALAGVRRGLRLLSALLQAAPRAEVRLRLRQRPRHKARQGAARQESAQVHVWREGSTYKDGCA